MTRRQPVPAVPYGDAVRLLSMRAGGPGGVPADLVVARYGLDDDAAAAAIEDAGREQRRGRAW